MLLEDNHYTTALHNDWRMRIKLNFPDIDFSNSSDFLSIIYYIDKAPYRFYSKKAFQKYLEFLKDVKLKDSFVLASILNEAEVALSLSNQILTEISNEQIHDIILPSDNNDLIDFIDKKIHYNLLKIYESPFFQFSHLIAKYSWSKQKKGIDGLDLLNSVRELIKKGFSFIEPFYLHNVRNGIAHGKIVYSDLDITYIDKKGNKEKVDRRGIIDAFDGVLDISNGFCLALKVFYFTEPDYLEKYKISIPLSILISELQAKANAPAWVITNCLESIALQDKRQLMIYIKNDNWDFNKVQWFSFNTAYWAERLTKCYDRIFFNYYSIHNKFSPGGWAAFNAKKMRELRENNETAIENYSDVLEDNLLFFIPKIKFPRIVYKLGALISIMKTIKPLHWKRYLDTYFPNPFIIRDALIHSNGRYAVVQDASLIIKSEFQDDIIQLIRTNRKKIVKKAIKFSKSQCSHLSLLRYLPVKYVMIYLYDRDLRTRNLRFSGLIPELIATIEVNTSKRIKTRDIFNGTPEQYGKYRIIWHNNWHGKNVLVKKYE